MFLKWLKNLFVKDKKAQEIEEPPDIRKSEISPSPPSPSPEPSFDGATLGDRSAHPLSYQPTFSTGSSGNSDQAMVAHSSAESLLYSPNLTGIPKPRPTHSLPQLFDDVIEGRATPMSLYVKVPSVMKGLIDNLCTEFFGTKFEQIENPDIQKSIIAEIKAAMDAHSG